MQLSFADVVRSLSSVDFTENQKIKMNSEIVCRICPFFDVTKNQITLQEMIVRVV